ncbi:MAG: hypothetical protein QM689_06210 [Oscillospiraceae bacterium]
MNNQQQKRPILSYYIIVMSIGVGMTVMLSALYRSHYTDNESLRRCLNATLITLMALVIFPMAVRAVSLLLKSRTVKSRLRALGYSDEFYRFLDKTYRRKRGFPSPVNALICAAQYANGERYAKAHEILDGISPAALSKNVCAEYYNARLYLYLMENRLPEAEQIYFAVGAFLESQKYKKTGAGIFHTLAVLELHRGNFAKAESDLAFILAAFRGKQIRFSCGLYLALVYLRTGRCYDAKRLAAELLPLAQNPRDQSDLARLMKLIEKSFAQL